MVNDVNQIVGLLSVTPCSKKEKGVKFDLYSYVDKFESKYSQASFVKVHTLLHFIFYVFNLF